MFLTAWTGKSLVNVITKINDLHRPKKKMFYEFWNFYGLSFSARGTFNWWRLDQNDYSAKLLIFKFISVKHIVFTLYVESESIHTKLNIS